MLLLVPSAKIGSFSITSKRLGKKLLNKYATLLLDGAFLWNCLIFSIKDSEIVLAAKVVLIGNAETGAFTIFVKTIVNDNSIVAII